MKKLTIQTSDEHCKTITIQSDIEHYTFTFTNETINDINGLDTILEAVEIKLMVDSEFTDREIITISNHIKNAIRAL